VSRKDCAWVFGIYAALYHGFYQVARLIEDRNDGSYPEPIDADVCYKSMDNNSCNPCKDKSADCAFPWFFGANCRRKRVFSKPFSRKKLPLCRKHNWWPWHTAEIAKYRYRRGERLYYKGVEKVMRSTSIQKSIL